MSVHDRIDTWLEAASDQNDPHPGITSHSRGGTVAPPTPASRVIELTQNINLLRSYLNEAVQELKSELRHGEQFHNFQHTSFAGMPMAQHFSDMIVWEAVLNGMGELGGIIEIGTWQGGFSGWLWAQAELRGARFHTYDATAPDKPFHHGFQRLDVFKHPETVREQIAKFEIHSLPVVLFCDGGNKPRELQTFASMVKHPESVVAVHDWGTETLEHNVPDNLTMIHRAYCESMRSITRFFKVER